MKVIIKQSNNSYEKGTEFVVAGATMLETLLKMAACGCNEIAVIELDTVIPAKTEKED